MMSCGSKDNSSEVKFEEVKLKDIRGTEYTVPLARRRRRAIIEVYKNLMKD